ncbi:MAG: hypothetical protein ACR2PT_23945 [Endozoicomonas sp.]
MNIGGPTEPNGSGRFVGRDRVPQAGVNKNLKRGVKDNRLLIAKTANSEPSVKNFFGRLIIFLKNPPRYLSELRKDKRYLADEVKNGGFTPIENRKIRRTNEQIGSVVKKEFNNRLERKDKDLPKYLTAPADSQQNHPEYLHTLKHQVSRELGPAGGAATDVGLPKQVREEMQAQVHKELKASHKKNKSVSKGIVDVIYQSDRLQVLTDEIKEQQETLDAYRARLDHMSWYQTKEKDRAYGETRVFSRSELKKEVATLERKITMRLREQQRIRSERTRLHDFERETEPVVDSLKATVEEFQRKVNKAVEFTTTKDHDPVSQRILREPDNFKKVYQYNVEECLSDLRDRDIPNAENQFLAAKGKAREEREVAAQIHAMRLATQRLTTITESSKDLDEMNERISSYLNGKTESLLPERLEVEEPAEQKKPQPASDYPQYYQLEDSLASDDLKSGKKFEDNPFADPSQEDNK